MRYVGQIVVALIALVACTPSYEDVEAKAMAEEAAARARAKRQTDQRLAEQKAKDGVAKAQDAAAIEKTKAQQAERGARLAARRATYAEMTPALRERALREICAGEDGCSPDDRGPIVEAAASETERAKLQALADKLGERYAEIYAVSERQAFVGAVAVDLIKRYGLGNVVVHNDGPKKTRLLIEGTFCSAEFLEGFAADGHGTRAKAVGYKAVKCTSPSGTWAKSFD